MTREQLATLYTALVKESDEMREAAGTYGKTEAGNIAFFTVMAGSRTLLGLASALSRVIEVTPEPDRYDGK